MRQMEKSTRDFADWRKEREKEVMQLKRQVDKIAACSYSFASPCIPAASDPDHHDLLCVVFGPVCHATVPFSEEFCGTQQVLH